MEDTCAESFAQGNDAVVFVKELEEDNSDFTELSGISNRKGSVTNTRTHNHRRKPSKDATNLEQLSQKIFQRLKDLIKKAKTVLAMSKDSENLDTHSSDSSDFSSSQSSDSLAEATLESKEKCGSPHTPTSVLPTRTQKSLNPLNPPLLWLSRTVVGEMTMETVLHPVTPATPAITSQPVFSPNSASSSSAPVVQSTIKPKPAPPPPPPPPRGKLPAPPPPSPSPPPPPPPPPGKLPPPPPPPPPMSGGRGKLPPPPPPGGSRLMFQRSNSKLKRSSQIGNLYRGWKHKFECPVQQGKSSPSQKRVGGSANGGKGGMAQALEEMSKRSSYFQKIAQDVELFGEQITSMKNAIDSFETRNMDELLTFYQSVESLLEKLTDESQVLSKFEGFPTKKLEVIRTAAGLYSKLSKKLTELKSWKVEPPFAKQLDAINTYFEKLKKEIEDIERVKDKDSKTFQSQKIHFDYDIIIRVKEAMVDLSSNCISLALEESKATKTAVKERTGSLKSTKNDRQLIKCFQNLWKALQLSYRVYSFAGGLDDRAGELASLLDKEMDIYPQYCWSL